jgi:hypothetical protein
MVHRVFATQEHAPEERLRMGAHKRDIQAVPILFHFPDEIRIGIEAGLKARDGGEGDPQFPQIVGRQMAEIPPQEGGFFFVGFRLSEVRAEEAEIIHPVRGSFGRFEMGNLAWRVEGFTFLIGDPGIGGDTSDREGSGEQAGNFIQQVFRDAQMDDPGCHSSSVYLVAFANAWPGHRLHPQSSISVGDSAAGSGIAGDLRPGNSPGNDPPVFFTKGVVAQSGYSISGRSPILRKFRPFQKQFHPPIILHVTSKNPLQPLLIAGSGDREPSIFEKSSRRKTNTRQA